MTQLLLYKSAVPISRARHGDCHVEGGGGYAFTEGVNSVPLLAVEFPQAASENTIVFTGPDDDITPAVILGIRGNQNLYVSHDTSQWRARYIPAFIRRYPFVFSRDGDRHVLCVDEAYAGLNREGRGQKLFAEDGSASPYVNGILQFLQEYQNQHARTQAFCQRIKALDLLEPMQAQVVTEGGGRLSISGFQVVSRSRLKALPVERLGELVAGDELELLYLHLQSIRNFETLKGWLEHAPGDLPPAPGPGDLPPAPEPEDATPPPKAG
jgi:hypothetical protein